MVWTRMKQCVLAIAAVLMISPGAQAAPESLEGRWLTGKRKVAITLFPCGDEFCGRIDWLAKPYTSEGTLKIDSENPDPSLRDRPYCGIQVITKLRESRPGVWKGGDLYNPQDGRTYDIQIKTDGDGLKVRAYLGVKLLGKTENWIAAPEDTPGCVEAADAES
ncbi:MAG: DUF2147 domain-containing protein [Pseudomonadota bacterium]